MAQNKLKALFSRASDNWATPDYVLSYLKKKYNVKDSFFDPCPLYAFDEGRNSLTEDWNSEKNIYINPPYSDIVSFVNKAIETHKENKGEQTIIFLIPARTDTKYFEKLFDYGCEFEFITGRLKFGESEGSAPFPSVIVVLKGNKQNTINYIHRNEMINALNKGGVIFDQE